MTTTFARLKQAGACTSGYRTLAKHLGSVEEYGEDKEINLLTILDSNGLDDALWCLRATVQDCDKEKRLIACEFAESVLHIFESKRPNDDRPRKAIEAAKQFANGEISREEMLESRRAAAYAAAAVAAAADAAYAAAAVAAAADAAYAAAADAAYAAAAVAAAAAADAAAVAVAAASVAAAAAVAADAAVAAASVAAASVAAAAARKQKKEQLAEIFRKHLQDE